MLIEGADVGLDHSNDSLLLKLVGAEFRNDILLGNITQLNLSEHSITANLSKFGGLNISKKSSPFPDAVEAIREIVAKTERELMMEIVHEKYARQYGPYGY